MPFTVSKQAMNRVLNLGDLAGAGVNTSIVFDPVRGMVVIKTIPERVMQAVTNETRGQRDLWQKGRLINNTQGHWLPIASLPAALHEQWKQELGDPKRDPDAARRWKQRFNSNEYRSLRTSDYHL